jgi:hypothetical protein
MTILTVEQIKEGLSGFCGTEAYHKFSVLFPKVVMTDGAKYLADSTGAYWFMDIIGSVYAAHPNRKQFWEHGFAVWTLKVEGSQGVVTADDGNDNLIYTQEIPYTDFPFPEITLYTELGETTKDGLVMVIMLPRER